MPNETPKKRAGSSAIDNDLVKHLAETTDLSPNQALELVQRHGTDREKLEQMAKTMKAES